MDKEFHCKDGVLKKYTGPGGQIILPEGITEIGNEDW